MGQPTSLAEEPVGLGKAQHEAIAEVVVRSRMGCYRSGRPMGLRLRLVDRTDRPLARDNFVKSLAQNVARFANIQSTCPFSATCAFAVIKSLRQKLLPASVSDAWYSNLYAFLLLSGVSMSSGNEWTWPSISAGVFIAVVGAVVGGLLVAGISPVLFPSRNESAASSVSTVTVEPPAVTATATVTVTATPPVGPPAVVARPPTDGPDTPSPPRRDPTETGAEDVLLLSSLRSAVSSSLAVSHGSYKIGGSLYPDSIDTDCSSRCLDNPSFIEYGIPEGYSRFRSVIGINQDKGSSDQVVTFRVRLIGLPGGGSKDYVEENVALGRDSEFDIPLEGATRIRLETYYGGSDPKEAKDMRIYPVWGTPAFHRN